MYTAARQLPASMAPALASRSAVDRFLCTALHHILKGHE